MPNRTSLIQPIASADLRLLLEMPEEELRTSLGQLADRQSKAEAQELARMATRMLSLAETLCEYDETAASHLLKGLLRLAAHGTSLSVETTAMRISGIADLHDGTLSLTDDGLSVLGILSGKPQGDLSVSGHSGHLDIVPHSAPEAAPVPFAQMVFGDRTFEIADGADEESLTFRLKGKDQWHQLENNRYAGWDVIGAEMLSLTSDTLQDYLHMHTMRISTPELGANVHSFTLEAVTWWIEIDDNVARFRVSEKAEWQIVPSDIQEKNVRELGIKAVLRMYPDFRQKVDQDRREWLRRMAHAAGISPVMSAAA